MSDAPNAEVLAAVRKRAEAWGTKLIDLNPSKNSLLLFRPGRGTQIDLTDCDAEALRRLRDGDRVRLSHILPEDDLRSRVLKQLSSLRRKVAQLEEEQGFDPLRIAFGLFRTSLTADARTRAAELRAPVLLSSVDLTPVGNSGREFSLELTDELEGNPVLPHALNRLLGLPVDVPEYEEQVHTLIEATSDRRECAARVAEYLSNILHAAGLSASFEDIVGLGFFNYEKYPMVRDLQESTELLATSRVVAALAGHAPSAERLKFADTDPLPTGDAVAPEDDLLVLDADASQQAAINAALHRRNAVIVGPPGTGKSQTIANIVACAAAAGRTVLFVAEKRAAIEAVTDRLASVRLDGLVFDLHKQQVRRREVAQQLADTLQRAVRQPQPQVEQLHRDLSRLREQASAHARTMNSVVPPWNLSPFEMQSRLLGNPDAQARRIRIPASRLRQFGDETLRSADENLRNYIHVGGLRVRRGVTPWAAAQLHDVDDVRIVLAELDKVNSGVLTKSRTDLDDVLAMTQLRRPVSLGEWQGLLWLIEDVGRSVAEFGGDIFAAPLDDFVAAAAPRRSSARQLRPLTWRERRRYRKEARRTSRSKLSGPPLFAALQAALAQREAWARASDGPGAPRQVQSLERVLEQFSTAHRAMTAVAACLQLRGLEDEPTTIVDEHLQALEADRAMAGNIVEVNQRSERLVRLGLTALLDLLAERESNGGPVSADDASVALEAAWLASVEQELRLSVPSYQRFTGDAHDDAVRAYARHDQEHLRMNAQRVRRRVAEHLWAARQEHRSQSLLVEQEAKKKSRHKPLRELLDKAPDVVLAAHPCWAMSPLVVSKILPARRLFDLVVFDEASKVRPHDAVTSIMRGDQVVVTGDPKQLPPNNLFAWLEAESPDDDAMVEADLGDYESILDVLEPVLPMHLLRWHYRSRDDRLIAFSNQHFYRSDLITFAGCRQESPIRLDVVDGTASPGSNGIAQAEVERVVELVRQHALLHPGESLGVIAFGSKQSDAIEQRLRTAEDPNLADFIARHDVSGRRLFVKNLERVQGDERDAVILSVGKAKSPTGVVTLHFGALGNEGGERRLNVAVTRAKSRLTVVSSFHPAELRPNVTKNPGPELLRQFLEFADAEGARTPSVVGRSRDDVPLNGFERSILDALTSRGIDVHPQWGIGDYSIDFALAHPSEPGRMVLALEADGDRYHRAPAARDRDRLRQEHLERLGWRFHRVWSSDWFRSPEVQAARIEDAWRRAVEDADRPAPLPESAPAPVFLDDLPAVDRGPCPIRIPRDSIDDYSHQELVTFFAWLLTDDLLFPEEDRLREALAPLGFQKLGSKIRNRMTSALALAQRRATEGSADARIG